MYMTRNFIITCCQNHCLPCHKVKFTKGLNCDGVSDPLPNLQAK